MSQRPDEIYYAHAGSLPLMSRISLYARRKNYTRFMELMRPGEEESILDIGVSMDVSSIEANTLEQFYPRRDRITCAGLEDCQAIEKVYQGTRFVRIRHHEPLPFADRQFDIVYSNAVLEHVGSRAQQGDFVREALRVGRRVFLVVPNRLFPVEHHTGLPLVHYLPPAIFRALLKFTPWRHWADERNLNHLTAGELRGLFPERDRVRIVYAGLGLGPFQSNLIAHT